MDVSEPVRYEGPTDVLAALYEQRRKWFDSVGSYDDVERMVRMPTRSDIVSMQREFNRMHLAVNGGLRLGAGYVPKDKDVPHLGRINERLKERFRGR